MTQQTPWTIAEWRKAHLEGVEMQLPSGMVARVRPVNASTFLRSGRIPDQLTPVVGRMLGQTDPQPITSMDEALEQLKLLDAFAMTCIVSPRIVEGPDCGEDELTVDMLSDLDKGFLFAFLGRPASELAAFRPGPAGDVVAVGGEQDGTKSTE